MFNLADIETFDTYQSTNTCLLWSLTWDKLKIESSILGHPHKPKSMILATGCPFIRGYELGLF